MKIYRSLKTNIITQKFGENKIPIYKQRGLLGHNGWDWKAYDGEPLYFDVLSEGTVYQKHTDSAGGLGLDIITQDKNGDYWKQRYWHLKSYKCEIGDIVETGQLIALADNTGRSTGTHLHRGLKPQRIDPNGNFRNKFPKNGYRGGVDIEPYFKNVYSRKIWLIKNQISLIQRIIKILTLQIKISLK